MTKKRKPNLIFFSFILLLLAAIAAFTLAWYQGRELSARREWKDKALPEISTLTSNKDWVDGEKDLLTNSQQKQNQRIMETGWLTDKMILMKSGEWLVYKSHCSKRPPKNVRDIFLANGSDGKWYYSTCHFCVALTTLRLNQQDPPKDLASFAKRYQLREFDGVSDDCLKETKELPENMY